MRISAEPKARAGSLGDNLCPRSGHRGEQPVKAAFPGDEFDSPDAFMADKFVMPFGDTQYIVKRLELDPFSGYPLLPEHGREHFAQGRAEPPGL